jgi:hypothetical protein
VKFPRTRCVTAGLGETSPKWPGTMALLLGPMCAFMLSKTVSLDCLSQKGDRFHGTLHPT